MKFIVDRIEEGIAICEKEDLSRVNIDISLLPKDTHEGSVIINRNGEYVLDLDEEESRRERMLELQRRIFKKNS